jgi:hypothetical protein
MERVSEREGRQVELGEALEREGGVGAAGGGDVGTPLDIGQGTFVCIFLSISQDISSLDVHVHTSAHVLNPKP